MKKYLFLSLATIMAVITSCTKEVDTTTVVLKADFADSLLLAADIRIDYVILNNAAQNVQSDYVNTTSWRKSGPGNEGAFRIVFTPKDTLECETYDLSFSAGIVFQVVYKDGTDATFKGDQMVADASGVKKEYVTKDLAMYSKSVKLATYLYRTSNGEWVSQHDDSFDDLWSEQ